jgi:hypothetical protein
VLIAVASFRRPRAERIPIWLFAIGLGLALNRDLTGNHAAAHVAVIACGLSAAWFGYTSTSTSTPANEPRRLMLAILFVMLGFLGFFFSAIGRE